MSESPFQDLEFSVAFGVTTTLDLSQARFRAFMLVDNPGSYWLHFPQLTGVAAWVPPTVLGWNSELPFDRPANLKVTSSDVPSGYSADTSNQIVSANISVRSRPPIYSPGAPQLQKTSITTTFLPVNIALSGVNVGAIPLPANAIEGVTSLPVLQGVHKSTYDFSLDTVTTGALVANTDKPFASIEHDTTSLRLVRIKRIALNAIIIGAGAAASAIKFYAFTGTALSTAGTGVTPTRMNQGQNAAEVTCKTLPTIVAATGPKCVRGNFAPAVVGALGNPAEIVLYQYDYLGEEEELVLRKGVRESVVLVVNAASTPNITIYGSVTLTEET